MPDNEQNEDIEKLHIAMEELSKAEDWIVVTYTDRSEDDPDLSKCGVSGSRTLFMPYAIKMLEREFDAQLRD